MPAVAPRLAGQRTPVRVGVAHLGGVAARRLGVGAGSVARLGQGPPARRSAGSAPVTASPSRSGSGSDSGRLSSKLRLVDELEGGEETGELGGDICRWLSRLVLRSLDCTPMTNLLLTAVASISGLPLAERASAGLRRRAAHISIQVGDVGSAGRAAVVVVWALAVGACRYRERQW